jgi:hypothetical protein
MKNLALLAAGLLLVACSDGGKNTNLGQGGAAGGEAGTSGSGAAGTTGGAGTTGSAGTTGAAGRGGTTGAGGQGGTGGQSCSDLANAYSQAMMNARMCKGDPPCSHLVTASLQCGCQAWVSDTTELDKIQAQWTAAGCTTLFCPILCVNTGTHAVCVPNDSGDWCTGAP